MENMQRRFTILVLYTLITLGCAGRQEARIMQIKFERSGGLFAGNTLEGTVDLADEKNAHVKSGAYTRKLAPEETRQLRDALHSANLSRLKGDLRRTDAKSGADQYQYDVTVQMSNGETHEFTVGDGPLASTAAAAVEASG